VTSIIEKTIYWTIYRKKSILKFTLLYFNFSYFHFCETKKWNKKLCKKYHQSSLPSLINTKKPTVTEPSAPNNMRQECGGEWGSEKCKKKFSKDQKKTIAKMLKGITPKLGIPIYVLCKCALLKAALLAQQIKG
jgi:hypothetical protein